MADSTQRKSYSITYVEDADTISVKRGLESFNVRFSFIDAPEVAHSNFERNSSHHSIKNQLEWGEKAKDRVEQLIKDKEVELQVTGKDKYGRSLSEVFLNGQSLQEQLLREGLVKANYPFIKNKNDLIRIQDAESIASKQRLGIWGDPDFINPSQYRESLRSNSFHSNPFASLVQPDTKLGSIFLPTSLSENFSATYPGSVPQLYTDTFYTLKGKMPVGYQKHLAQNADSQLSPQGRENLLSQAAHATKAVPPLSGTLAFANLLLQGNYGSTINRLFPDLYSPGQGFAGTIAKGVGRILDTATGFYSNEYYENLREGKLSGGLNKFHRNQYETYQNRGFFENLMGGVTATGTALTSSLAFYFGLSHTLSIARSHFEDIGVDYVTSLLGKTSNNVTNNVLKSLFFAPELLNVFDEIDHAYGTAGTAQTPVPKGKQFSDYLEYVMYKAGEITNLSPTLLNLSQQELDFFNDAFDNSFSDKRKNTNNLIKILSLRLKETKSTDYAVAKAAVEKDIIGINRQTGEFDLSKGLVSGFNSPSGGILSTIGSLRRIDQSNFINIIRPVLEHITIGTDVELATLNNELNTLQTDVGKSPFLKFADVEDGLYTYLDDLTAEEYGYRRLEKLASSLDKIAEYVPANPLLYFKPYRDMMGVTSLKVDKGNGEFENYSLKQLIGPGFSGLTNFSRRMTRSIGALNSTDTIVRGVADNFKLFEYEYKLSKTEQSLASKTNKILRGKYFSRSIANLKGISSDSTSNLLDELNDGLYGNEGAVRKLAGQLGAEDKTRNLIQSYTKNLKEYNTLLQRTGNSQDAFNSPPPSVFRSIRNVLFSVAPILILDKVLDSQLMRAPSLDLVSQVFTDINFLNEENDRDLKPNMNYTGAVPGYIKYPVTAAGFLLGGHLLPKFTHNQLAAGGVIEKAVDKAVGGQPLLATLNSNLTGQTGLSSLLEGLDVTGVDDLTDDLTDDALVVVKALSKTRTSTRFGYLGAFVGGATALLATQAFFGIASGLLNAAKSFSKGEGFKPQSESMVAAFSLTAAIRQKFESFKKGNAITAQELGLMEVGYAAANNLLYGRPNSERQVYTFATQIPNPIFQFTAVSKLDPQGNSLTLGAGFQFLPILGAGSIPPAPFEVRLKPVTTRASQKRERLQDKSSTTAADLLSILSFPGQLIAVNKDTSFSQVISFVGASSYVASATSKVENFLKANSGTALKRELNQVKPLYNIGKFGLASVETLARYSQVPLLVMPNALMKAATSFFNVPKESLAKLGAKSRVLAPYALAYAFAAGITGADGSFANVGSEHDSNYAASELSRFGTVATLTGIYGYGLHKAGAFARADSFAGVVGNSFIAKKQQQLSAIATEAMSKGLTEAPLVRTAALRLSIASRRIFSISAVLAAAGLGLRGLTQRSLGFLDVISDSQDVPANKEEAAYQRALGFSPARYQPKNLQEAAGNYLNYLTRSIGGLLGIDKLVYRDDPNAFLSLGGPFGTSVGKAGFRLYTQAQATFVDISGSSYSLGQIMMNSDLSMQLLAALSGLKSTNYDKASKTLFSDRYHRIRGATSRKTPAKIYGELSSSEAAAAAGGSSAFIAALAYRKAYADNLKHQRPSELSLDLLYEAAKTGRLGSKFGLIKPSYSPLATLGSITGEISAGTSSALELFASTASNFIRGLTGTSPASAEELLTRSPREQTNRIPVLSYFSDSLGYVLGGFSGKSTPAATGIIAAQQVPLILLSVGSSLTFLVQMSAALAAYNQGALNQDSLRQAENKRLDFSRKAQIKIGYTEIDNTYSLTIEPITKGAAKPKLLTLSSDVLQDTNTVVATDSIELTKEKLKRLSQSTQGVIRKYYEGVADLLEPSGTSSLGNIPLNGLDNTNISDYVDNLKEHVKANLLERNIVLGSSPVKKLQEILSLSDDSAKDLLNTLDSLKVELTTIQAKNVSVEAAANLSRVAIASKLQDLDNRLLGNATTGYVKDSELKAYTKPIGLSRSKIASQSGAGLATSEIISKSGYIGLFKEAAAGAGRLVNKLVDIVPFYNIASALTKAAGTEDHLERSRAAGAAAYYTMQLPSIGIMTFGLKALFANPLLGTALVGAGLGLFVADQYFNKGRVSKSIVTASNWFDRNIGSKMTNSLARSYNKLAGIPIINTALTIAGLPFRMLDPVFEGLWKSVENSPAGYFAMSLLLPQSVDQVYDALGAKTPGRNRAGERMELVSPAEIRSYEAQRLKYNRARASSIKANLYTEISPFLLGGTVSESERQLEERYFNSGGGTPRVLAPFANTSHVSSLLQMAIGRRQLEADFAGYGSYKKRRLLGYAGLGTVAIASSTYYKASLAYDGTYSGLLKHGLTSIGNIFSSIARKTGKLVDNTLTTLERAYQPVGKLIDFFKSIPRRVGETINKIGNFTPIKATVGLLKTPSALLTLGVAAIYFASELLDKKGESREQRLTIAGTTLAAGLGSFAAYKYSAPSIKKAIKSWAHSRQPLKLPPIIARSSIFALSAFAITTTASQIAVNLVGTASNYFGFYNENDKYGNENIANFSSVQSSMILGGVAAGLTFTASSLSDGAQSALARGSVNFYRGLAASLPGAALYAAPAWAVSKIVGLGFSDEGTTGKIKREAQNWATGSFALLGAYRYGLSEPFFRKGIRRKTFTRLELLSNDWKRIKGIGEWIGKLAALVPGGSKGLSLTNKFVSSVVKTLNKFVSSAVTTLDKFNIFKNTKNYPIFRQTKSLLSSFGKFAYNFAPSVIDVGLYGYAAYDISQLNNRSTRQQYRAAYQNLTGVSVNAVAGTLLALKMRSPAAALVFAINAERTINPLIGKALGDAAYESGEDQTVRNLALGVSGTLVFGSAAYGLGSAIKAAGASKAAVRAPFKFFTISGAAAARRAAGATLTLPVLPPRVASASAAATRAAILQTLANNASPTVANAARATLAAASTTATLTLPVLPPRVASAPAAATRAAILQALANNASPTIANAARATLAAASTTVASTTVASTTVASTTVASTTVASTTVASTTAASTTAASTTAASTTAAARSISFNIRGVAAERIAAGARPTLPVLSPSVPPASVAPTAAAARSLLSRSLPTFIGGVYSTVQTGSSIYNLDTQAKPESELKDYRLATQDIGKEVASLTTSTINAAGLLGGPKGVVITSIATAVAEPYISSSLSSSLTRRMQVAGRTSKTRAAELKRNVAHDSKVGLAIGIVGGIILGGVAIFTAGVTLPVAGAIALTSAVGGAAAGAWVGIERFFWGTKSSPFDKGDNKQTSSSKGLDHAYYLQKKKQQESGTSIIVASADLGQSDVGMYSFEKEEKEESLNFLGYLRDKLYAVGGLVLETGRKVKRAYRRLKKRVTSAAKRVTDNVFGSQEFVEPSEEGGDGVSVVTTYYTPGEGAGYNGPKLDARGKYIDSNSNVAAVRNLGLRGGLPYGSVILVTNPETGHSEKLTVQDTGPFYAGQRRGLDITKGAYDRLGGTGLSKFNVKIVSVPGGKLGQVYKLETPDNFSYELVYGTPQRSGGFFEQVGVGVGNIYTQHFDKDAVVREKLNIRNSINQRVLTTFAETEIHHPRRGKRGKRANRDYRDINGALEEVNRTNPNLIKKDFLLSKKGSLAVNVPAPVAGYVGLDSSWGAVAIYEDANRTKLLAVVGHLNNYKVKAGQYVKYGQDLGLQGGKGGYEVHTHMELTIEGYNRYFKDVQDGVFDGKLNGSPNVQQSTQPVVKASLKNKPPAKIADWATPKQPATRNIIFISGHRLDIDTGTGGTDKIGTVLFKGENRTIESVGTEIAAEVFSSVFKSRGFNVIAPPALPSARGDEARKRYQDKVAAQEVSSNAYALELHFDEPKPGKPGVIPGSKYDPSGKYLNVMDNALAKEFGSFSYYWGEGGKDVRQVPDAMLGGPKRGISLLELDKLDSRLTKLILKGVRTGNFDEYRKAILPYANRAAEALSLNETSAPAEQATESYSSPTNFKGKLKLSTGYESLNVLASTLSNNKYFDQSTAKGRAALATALLIGGAEAFGKGVTRTDHFTNMGGAGNRMKGFAQFNITYFSRETSTQQGYINLIGSMLTGERTLPTGRGKFNSAELALAVQQGKVSTGKQLIQFVQGRITKTDWQGLYDGIRRVPGLADQLVDYLKQSATDGRKQTATAFPTKPKTDSLFSKSFSVSGSSGVNYKPGKTTGEKVDFYFADKNETKTLSKPDKNKQSFVPSLSNEAVSVDARNSLTSSSLQLDQLEAITKEYKEQTQALEDLQKKGEQKLQNLTVVIAQDTTSRKPTEQPNEPFKSSAKAPEIATGAAVSSSDKGLAVRLTTKVDDAYHVETTASPFPTHVNKELVSRESSGGSMGSGNQDLFGLAGGWMSNQFA